MDNLKFRSRAKVVAIVDMVLSSMELTVCLVLIIMALFMTEAAQISRDKKFLDQLDSDSRGNMEQASEQLQGISILIWIVAILVTFTTILQIVAAVKLLNGTQLGKNPTEAHKLCRFWRGVTIFFTILTILSLFGTTHAYGYYVNGISIVLRVLALYIVHLYMKELETVSTYSAHGGLPTQISDGANVNYTPPPAYDNFSKGKQ